MRLWRRYLAWRLRHVERLEPGDDGFVLRRYRGDAAVRWQEIERVAAYKRDCYTVDLLCLLVQAGGQLVELNEDMAGFEDVTRALEQVLGIAPDWRMQVLFPAFATNPTILYGPPLDPAGAAD